MKLHRKLLLLAAAVLVSGMVLVAYACAFNHPDDLERKLHSEWLASVHRSAQFSATNQDHFLVMAYENQAVSERVALNHLTHAVRDAREDFYSTWRQRGFYVGILAVFLGILSWLAKPSF